VPQFAALSFRRVLRGKILCFKITIKRKSIMSELTKFHILRPVQRLTPEIQSTIGLPTHANGDTSAWYALFLQACMLRDQATLVQMALDFLEGTDALHDFSQLDAPLYGVIQYLQRKGLQANATEIEQLATSYDLDLYFNGDGTKDGKALADQQKLEDTLLALSVLSLLGNPENANYQLGFRALVILRALLARQGTLSQADLQSILSKPLILPACRYNACTKKYAANQPFPHLDLAAIRGAITGTSTNGTRNTKDGRLDCNCGCDTPECQSQNTCCPELRFFVSDLMVLREELACYEPKHLAYIENVMAGETRERVHRNLERTETYSETETENTRSQENDHTVEDQFSLKSAVQKTVEQDLGVQAGVEFSGEFGTTKYSTHLDASYEFAKSEASQIAQEYARNVTTRAVSKVEEKVRQLNSTKQLRETEETNTYRFTNSAPNHHIIGQYFFVNMKNRAQVMNYGKRMMLEIIVPEPMELYKKLLEKDVLPFGMTPPEKIDFDASQISAATDGGEHGYLNLIKQWGLQGVEPMPDVDIRIPFSFDHNVKAVGENNAVTFQVIVGKVPSGYNGRGFTVDMKAYDVFGEPPLAPIPGSDPDDGTVQLDIELFVDGQNSMGQTVTTGLTQRIQWNPSPFDATQDSQITMAVLAKSVVAFAGSGYLYCELSAQAQMDWKISVFEKVQAAYQQQLEAYNTAKARYEQEKKARLPFGRNPFLNRDIERTELKRLAISHLSCQFYDRFNAMKRNVEPCGYPEMDLEQAQRDGAFIQFFEQAFEWNLMNYLFYPYFWGQKCSWPEKVQQVSNDPLFDKALSAGAARIQIPVRLGHEALALYWSYFGEIWLGAGQPPVAGSPYYLSMMQEIKEQKNCFYKDRPGTLSVTAGSTDVILSYGVDDVAEYNNDPTLVLADIDREIMINFEVYRIISIVAIPPTAPAVAEWKLTIASPYIGKGACGCDTPPTGLQSGVKYSTGAVFVGAPFDVTVPTNLVTLRNRIVDGETVIADCLPCYPLDRCE
jgi:hypothetical protein